MRTNHARRWLCLLVLLVGLGGGGAAVAASMTDYSESEDDIFWMFGACMVAGGVGFGCGVKIRLARDIANAA